MAQLVKFVKSESDSKANKFDIRNSDGELVSMDYLRRYIHCWCRVSDGYTHNRKTNIEYFMSDTFLAQHRGKTASQVGKAASIDARWNITPTTPATPTTPVAEFIEESDSLHTALREKILA